MSHHFPIFIHEKWKVVTKIIWETTIRIKWLEPTFDHNLNFSTPPPKSRRDPNAFALSSLITKADYAQSKSNTHNVFDLHQDMDPMDMYPKVPFLNWVMLEIMHHDVIYSPSTFMLSIPALHNNNIWIPNLPLWVPLISIPCLEVISQLHVSVPMQHTVEHILHKSHKCCCTLHFTSALRATKFQSNYTMP